MKQRVCTYQKIKKRLNLFWGISCIISLIVLSCNNNRSYPKLVFLKTTNNIDTVIGGESVTGGYTLYNMGERNLIIKDFKVSCECSHCNLTKGQTILANDSFRLTVKIDTDTSEIGKRKVLYLSLLCNTEKELNTLSFPIYIREE